jgi:two-component system response regulator RegX3
MKKILVVEDDVKIARALAIRLRAEGYQPIVAHDALTALASATKHTPDLILLDLTLPLGGGFSTIERLQNIPTTAAIPFIVVTAGKELDLRRRARELGAAGFFEKPYDPQQLLATIRVQLGEPANADEWVV